MTRRTVGVTFVIIAAFLWGVRFIAAAILGSGSDQQSEIYFQNLLRYVGSGPLYMSFLSLVIGISYLVWGEVEVSKAKRE